MERNVAGNGQCDCLLMLGVYDLNVHGCCLKPCLLYGSEILLWGEKERNKISEHRWITFEYKKDRYIIDMLLSVG